MLRNFGYGFILLLSAFLAACQSQPEITSGIQQVPGITIEISNDTCPGVTVAAGSQVTWVNRDGQEHIVHIETTAGEVVFDSGVLRPNDSVSFTFSQEGSFGYICSSGQDYIQTITVEP